jgi:osmotically-inducible protein OsmY
MNKAMLVLLPLLLNGCSTQGLTLGGVGTILGVGHAEITGLSLFHDRRDTETMITDEKIETEATLALNLNETIRQHVHFNVTAFNGRLLVTGEVPIQTLMPQINSTLQHVDDVKAVLNYTLLTPVASLSSRTYDSLITTKVKMAMASNPKLPGLDTTRIKVVTENGRVFLMGLVYEKEGDIAVEAARTQQGVKQVIKIFEYL